MDLLNTNVSLFETNETRADLYALWLSDYNVRVAVTKQQADEILDGSAGVVVINRGFADGHADTLVDIVRTRNPICAVVGTRTRSEGFPSIDPENHLVEPVFEDELVETVSRLLRRVNYRIALEEYYRATAALAQFEFSGEREQADLDEARREQHKQLEERAARLKRTLAEYRREMDKDDVAAVMQSLTFRDDIEHAAGETGPSSKYHPEKCTNCGRSWTVGSDDDRARGYKQLGAFVWRCVDCGHVQMQADPSHQRLGSYRL